MDNVAVLFLYLVGVVFALFCTIAALLMPFVVFSIRSTLNRLAEDQRRANARLAQLLKQIADETQRLTNLLSSAE